jgi:hypothetical protein
MTATNCVVATEDSGHGQLWRLSGTELAIAGTPFSAHHSLGPIVGLSCRHGDCRVLALTAKATSVAFLSLALGSTTWHRDEGPQQRATQFACAKNGHCVALGTTPKGEPRGEILTESWNAVGFQFAPTPWTDVACGRHRCALVGPSTVALFRP